MNFRINENDVHNNNKTKNELKKLSSSIRLEKKPKR